jgi:hypothetical protein
MYAAQKRELKMWRSEHIFLASMKLMFYKYFCIDEEKHIFFNWLFTIYEEK